MNKGALQLLDKFSEQKCSLMKVRTNNCLKVECELRIVFIPECTQNSLSIRLAFTMVVMNTRLVV